MNFMTFHILGMSSSHLTFIFFRGVETTNQKYSITVNPSTNYQSLMTEKVLDPPNHTPTNFEETLVDFSKGHVENTHTHVSVFFKNMVYHGVSKK